MRDMRYASAGWDLLAGLLIQSRHVSANDERRECASTKQTQTCPRSDIPKHIDSKPKLIEEGVSLCSRHKRGECRLDVGMEGNRPNLGMSRQIIRYSAFNILRSNVAWFSL